MPRIARTLAMHESELRSRIRDLLLLMNNPVADLGQLGAAACLVQSGCAAYRNRLEVAPPSERLPIELLDHRRVLIEARRILGGM